MPVQDHFTGLAEGHGIETALRFDLLQLRLGALVEFGSCRQGKDLLYSEETSCLNVVISLKPSERQVTLQVVATLLVVDEVESFDLLVHTHPQRRHRARDLQRNVTYQRTPDNGRNNR